MNADIAGVRVALSAPAAWLEGPLGARFRPFAPSAANPHAHLTIAVDPSAAEMPDPGPDAEPPDYPLDIVRDGARLTVRGFWLDGSLDLARGEGHALVAERDAAGSVENFLRVAVAHLLLPEGGFLLHAAGVVLGDGRAIVAFGPSGAGKTTLAGRAGERGGRLVVSDDLVALRRDAHGRLVVVPTPFRAGDAPPRPEGHVVRGLCRLRQGAEVGARRLPPAEAAVELLGSMPFVSDEPGTAELALARASEAAAEPGVIELAVPDRVGVWDLIGEVLR